MSVSNKSICVCTSYGVLQEPRFRRHTLALAAAFPHWRFLAIDCGTERPTADEQAAFSTASNVEYRRATYPTRSTGLIRTAKSKLVGKLARGFYSSFGTVTPSAVSIRGPALSDILRSVTANVYIGYNIDTLIPVGSRAMQTGGALIFDCMEYYSDMGDGQSKFESQLIRAIEKKYFPYCRLILASSDGVARAVTDTYHVSNIVPIYNTPATHFDLITPKRSGFNLYWRNSVVGFGQRGLEDVLVAMADLPADVHLFVRGRPATDGGRAIDRRIVELKLERRVHIYPPHLPEEGVTAAAEFHVGMCPEQGGSVNMDSTVSNKLFDFMMAGLAVVVSDLAGIRTVVERAKAGLVFRNRDPIDLRAKLRELYDHPQLRKQFAANARVFALAEGNLEHEMGRLVRAVSTVFDGALQS